MWTSHQPRSFWIYIIKSKASVLNSLFSCTKPDSGNCKNGTDQNSERPRILGFLPMVWRTACSSSLTSWSHSFDLVAPCPPLHLPFPYTPGRYNIGCACLISGIPSFMNTTWETTQWKTPVTSRRAAAQPFQQPRASALEQHIASVREALGVESYYWGKECGAPGLAFRYQGFRLFLLL